MQSRDTLRLNKVRFVEAVVLLGILSAGAYAALHPTPDAPVAPPQIQAVDVTFHQLAGEFSANSIAFKKRYAGKSFRITDMVVSINAGDPPNVVFAGDGQTPYDALFDPSETDGLAKLKPGDMVTFTCETMDLSSQIGDCRLQ